MAYYFISAPALYFSTYPSNVFATRSITPSLSWRVSAAHVGAQHAEAEDIVGDQGGACVRLMAAEPNRQGLSSGLVASSEGLGWQRLALSTWRAVDPVETGAPQLPQHLKETMGMPPHQYLIKLRVEHAHQLLQSGRHASH